MIDQAEKAELHCHLDGLLCPAYVRAVQSRGFCSGLDLVEMQRLYPVKRLEEWFRLSGFLAPFVDGNGELLLEVLKLHLRDLVAQNVRYAEIMLCSFLGADDARMDRLMQAYQNVAAGIEGIEAIYPRHTEQQRAEYREFARAHGLIVTGGSDCHGDRRANSLIGQCTIPYTFVQDMRRRFPNPSPATPSKAFLE